MSMQYLGMGGSASAPSQRPSSHHQSAVVLSSLPPSAELHDKMYADLVTSLIWSRDSAEKRAADAEERLHALEVLIASHIVRRGAAPPDTAVE